MTSDPHSTRSAHAPEHAGVFGSVILYRLLIAVSVILVLLIIGILVIRKKVASTVTPAEFAAMEKLETTEISLPRDWHRPADVPPLAVLEFHEKFQTQVQRLRAKHDYLIFGDLFSAPTLLPPYNGILESYWTSGTLTEAERTSFTLLMADLQPLLDETSSTVNRAEYTLELDSHILVVNFLEVSTLSKLLAILAGEKTAQGDCQQAFETAMLPLRLIRRPEQSSTITHLIGIALTNMVATSLYDVLEKCDDPAALQHAITSLDGMYEKIFPGEIHDWFHDEMVTLRFAAGYGYPVDLSPQSHADIVRQSRSLSTLPYFEWLVNELPSSDRRWDRAKQFVDHYKSERAKAKPLDRLTNLGYMSPLHQRLYTIITGVDPSLLFHVRILPNIEEAKTRAYTAKTNIDLARLAMVQRLAELEGADAPEGTAADGTTTAITAGAGAARAADDSTTAAKNLIDGIDTATITAYLTPPPIDPFTSGTYAYSAALTRHYSAGPDLDDDKAATKYDPTNGTSSNGDVWLTRRW